MYVWGSGYARHSDIGFDVSMFPQCFSYRQIILSSHRVNMFMRVWWGDDEIAQRHNDV